MKNKSRSVKNKFIVDYDAFETTLLVNESRALKFEDLGLKLPDKKPTEVVSIRLPTELLNELRAYGSQLDIPYQALIKSLLARGLSKLKKSA